MDFAVMASSEAASPCLSGRLATAIGLAFFNHVSTKDEVIYAHSLLTISPHINHPAPREDMLRGRDGHRSRQRLRSIGRRPSGLASEW
jgi:hypothetical protein